MLKTLAGLIAIGLVIYGITTFYPHSKISNKITTTLDKIIPTEEINGHCLDIDELFKDITDEFDQDSSN